MITDSANRQKSHFSQEMRRQRLVEALQNDTYLPIREGICDKEKRIAGEETRGSEVSDEGKEVKERVPERDTRGDERLKGDERLNSAQIAGE